MSEIELPVWLMNLLKETFLELLLYFIHCLVKLKLGLGSLHQKHLIFIVFFYRTSCLTVTWELEASLKRMICQIIQAVPCQGDHTHSSTCCYGLPLSSPRYSAFITISLLVGLCCLSPLLLVLSFVVSIWTLQSIVPFSLLSCCKILLYGNNSMAPLFIMNSVPT